MLLFIVSSISIYLYKKVRKIVIILNNTQLCQDNVYPNL